MNVKDQIIVITGAGRGIGRALAIGLAREGAKLSLCSRTAAEIQDTARECSRLSPWGEEGVIQAACDISDEAQVKRWIAETVKRFKRIDALINNAGILGPRVGVADYPYEEWQRVMRINVDGVFCVTQAVLRQAMVGQKEGVIINVSSGVGRVGKARWGAYAASKFACEGLTQVLAAEFKDSGIRAFSLNPEATRTSMRAAAYPEEDPAGLKEPDALLEAVLYLIGKASPQDSGKSFNWSELHG